MGSLPETFNDSTSFHLIVQWSLLPKSPQLSKWVQKTSDAMRIPGAIAWKDGSLVSI